MHLLSSVLATEGILCAGGVVAFSYWSWRAVEDPAEVSEMDFGETLGQPSYAPVLPVESFRYSIIKRAIDLTAALALLMVFAVPGCVIAALIVMTSKGPVFYREKRIGRYGYLFRIWKFRSMYLDADRRSTLSRMESTEAHLFWRMRKSSSDPRITKVGHFLRMWSLDELPQLLNVLTGDMSLIGPRPIIEAEVGVYGRHINSYVEAKPGLSGLWQVSGRSNIGYHQRAELDSQYVKFWNMKTDFKILIRTIPTVMKRIGAK